jgi:hypothetical protein
VWLPDKRKISQHFYDLKIRQNRIRLGTNQSLLRMPPKESPLRSPSQYLQSIPVKQQLEQEMDIFGVLPNINGKSSL